MDDEISLSFESWQKWHEWHVTHPFIFDQGYSDGIAQHIVTTGLVEPLTGHYASPEQITHVDGNWREGLICKGINSRIRAVMRLIEQTVDLDTAFDLRIYAPEAVTAFALRMRGIFPRFLGSEYTDDEILKARLYPIPCENLMALTLPGNTYDLVSSNEVLEHVPDLDQALREMCRVLKSGGWHIGTCPFRFMDEESQRRARIENGQLVHIMEPEYHGNPMSPVGSLVFEIPGWDILKRCREAGFGSAVMRFLVSRTYGCLSNHVGGIFVLMCQK